VEWGLHVIDLADGTVLASRSADTVLRTASIGKVFLLIEVARRLSTGELHPDDPCEATADHYVEDSGLLHAMRRRRLPVNDAAVLVAAVSDNLATNALLDLCGMEVVRGVASQLGLRRTTLLDYIRTERTPEMPWTPSYGTPRELAEVMAMLDAGAAFGPSVSTQVLDWLALGTDTSMVASALKVDPLAHAEPDPRGLELHHKTGTTSFARADIGIIRGPRGSVAYAVAANWPEDGPSLHVPVLDAMAQVGTRVVEIVEDGRP
jgi:Beta-lactamase class A